LLQQKTNEVMEEIPQYSQAIKRGMGTPQTEKMLSTQQETTTEGRLNNEYVETENEVEFCPYPVIVGGIFLSRIATATGQI
jgi:hypothetical protein